MNEAVIYNEIYQCISVANNQCAAYQKTITGNYVTPEVAGLLILYALLINVVAVGIRSMRQSF